MTSKPSFLKIIIGLKSLLHQVRCWIEKKRRLSVFDPFRKLLINFSKFIFFKFRLKIFQLHFQSILNTSIDPGSGVSAAGCPKGCDPVNRPTIVARVVAQKWTAWIALKNNYYLKNILNRKISIYSSWRLIYLHFSFKREIIGNISILLENQKYSVNHSIRLFKCAQKEALEKLLTATLNFSLQMISKLFSLIIFCENVPN